MFSFPEMEIECPSCKEQILIPDDEVTGVFECPFCLQTIELEQHKEDEVLPPKIDSKEKPKASPEPPLASAPLPSAESIMNDFRGPLLMPCPACGKSVSKKADICVGCGHPIYNGSLGTAGTRRAWNIIFLFFLLAGLFSCLLSGALTPLLRF